MTSYGGAGTAREIADPVGGITKSGEREISAMVA
jgi:hypothetical protein